MDIVNLRFFTVYGERQRPDLAINRFVKAIAADQPITMYGDGSTARDYTYVLDIVDGICKALSFVQKESPVFEIMNIGNHSPVSLKEMIAVIYEVMGKEPQINQIERQPGDVEITYADISKAQKMLGYHPSTNFKEGIERFVRWSVGQ